MGLVPYSTDSGEVFPGKVNSSFKPDLDRVLFQECSSLTTCEYLAGELPAQDADRGYNYRVSLCVIKGVVSDLVKESFQNLFALTTSLTMQHSLSSESEPPHETPSLFSEGLKAAVWIWFKQNPSQPKSQKWSL